VSSTTVVIGSKIGLHARPASIFSHAASNCGVAVTLTDPAGNSVNAASILGVLSLGISYGDRVTVSSPDENAASALDTLAKLLASELDK